MICSHTTLTPLSSEQPAFPEGKPLEVCYSEDGYLVFGFLGHDGGGIVFSPADAMRLRSLLHCHAESADDHDL